MISCVNQDLVHLVFVKLWKMSRSDLREFAVRKSAEAKHCPDLYAYCDLYELLKERIEEEGALCYG